MLRVTSIIIGTSVHVKGPRVWDRFSFLDVYQSNKELMKIPPPVGSSSFLDVPNMMTSFRAHDERINCVQCIDHRRFIITASVSSLIRIWTLSGRWVSSSIVLVVVLATLLAGVRAAFLRGRPHALK